ncbi:hypothetical protein TNCT_366721 [Trichonephila clavata]|uniref:Uncharacterized protein n=1 Tax=Trichonephila clavata TaxID=2740835 RepID=A0A8X6KVU0_TRICU|nr:hypothetical protein TNCT_366721 [Trichonephila clavata]
MFIRQAHITPVENSEQTLYHRPYVLMNAGWSYCDPSAGICGGVRNVRFARHDITGLEDSNPPTFVLCMRDGLTATVRGDGLTATRPTGICGGVRNVRFAKARHSPDFGRILNRRPYVLMHAGWSYRNPFAWHMRWGSVMFVPPRQDIHRPVEESRTELCIH